MDWNKRCMDEERKNEVLRRRLEAAERKIYEQNKRMDEMIELIIKLQTIAGE